MKFLDTNIFLRYLIDEYPDKNLACRALFAAAASGEESLITSEAVLGEVIYVLTSKRQYGLPHVEASLRLSSLLAIRGLHVAGKGLHLRALDLYSQYEFLDYEDALSVAYVESNGDISDLVSYDTDFDRLPWIRRSEP
jgi:predicted nucleic acid-binding protein